MSLNPVDLLRQVAKKRGGQGPKTASIPGVPVDSSLAEQQFMQAVKEKLEVSEGIRGDIIDAHVSWRDLSDAGVIQINANLTGPTSSGNSTIFSVTYPKELTDLSPPPVPTGVVASGAILHNIIQWDNPEYDGLSFTEIFSSATNERATATLAGTSNGVIFTHNVGPGAGRYYWVRFVSKRSVRGDFNAQTGTFAQTSQDPAWMLEQLAGEITESELASSLNSRIDLIDTAGPIDLPSGILSKIRDHGAEIYQANVSINDAGQKLLESALKIQENTDLLYDAGVTVDPGTGTVTIYGLTVLEDRMSNAEIDIDGANAAISLKASTTYVDDAIAAAVLDPSQVADLTSLQARMGTAEVDIDAIQASVTLKADVIDLDDATLRITTAETDINALQGEIVNKVETTTFNAVETRVSNAETSITTIEGSGVLTAVSDIRAINAQNQEDANTLLRNALTGHLSLEYANSAVAAATNNLTAFVDEELNAEAAERLALATRVGDTESAVLDINVSKIGYCLIGGLASDHTTRQTCEQAGGTWQTGLPMATAVLQVGVVDANGDTSNISQAFVTQKSTNEVVAAAIDSLVVTSGDNASAISNEQIARTSADSAIALSVSTLSSTVGDNTAAIQVNAESIDGVKAQLTFKVETGGVVSGFGISSELIDGGEPESTFIASVNKFAVMAPSGSVPAWAPSTAYVVGRIVGIAGNTTKMLVCKTAGTSGGSEPSIAGAIGSMTPVGALDGTVKWQIASRVPFYVLTTQWTDPENINGIPMNPGVYIDGAMIVNATIGSAQIGNETVDNSKIVDLTASKLTSGDISSASIELTSTGKIFSHNALGYDNFFIKGDGSAEFRNITIRNAAGDIVLASGVDASILWSAVQGDGTPEDGATVGAAFGDGVTTGNITGQITTGNNTTYIAEGAITNLLIGSVIQSTTFASGDGATPGTGWRVQKSGDAEFNNAIVRGTVYAAQGKFSGTLDGAMVLQSLGNPTEISEDVPGDYSTTVPAGVDKMRVILQAGGGGGGGGGHVVTTALGAAIGGVYAGGGGGGAGATIIHTFDVTPGQTVNYTVGSGGAPGSGGWSYATQATAGQPGTPSSVSCPDGTQTATSGAGGGGASGTQTPATHVVGSGGALAGSNGTLGIILYSARTPYGAAGGAGGACDYGASSPSESAGIGAGGYAGGAAWFDYTQPVSSVPDGANTVYQGYGGQSGGNGFVLLQFFNSKSVVTADKYTELLDWLHDEYTAGNLDNDVPLLARP